MVPVEIHSKWCVRFRPNSGSQFKVFCFHPAGGAAGFFSRWVVGLPESIDLVALQLPGRWERLAETPLTSVAAIVNSIFQALEPELNQPFAFVGYSFGAKIAFELARHLRKMHKPMPAHLLVLACAAPQIKRELNTYNIKDDLQFVNAIDQRYGGIPKVIKEDPEMMRVVIPALRADMTAFESYECIPEPKLDVPITAVRGTEDLTLSQQLLAAWGEQTSKAFVAKDFPGGHFFGNQPNSELAKFVEGVLSCALQEK